MPFFSTFTNDSMTKIRVARGIVTLKIPHRVYIYIWLFPKIGGNPQIIHFNRVWNHYKPSILGYPYFWKHPYIYIYTSSAARGGAGSFKKVIYT